MGKKKGVSGTATAAACDDDLVEHDSITLTTTTQDFISRLTKSFTDSFNSCVEKLILSMEQRFTHRSDVLEAQLHDANKRIDKLESACQKLESENTKLHDVLATVRAKNDKLEVALDDVDQYSRNSNLIIHGVRHENNFDDNIPQNVTAILNTNLQLNLQPSDVAVAHRIRRQTPTQPLASQTPKPQPIVVQFSSRAARNSVLQKRKLLKGKGVSVTEQLTGRRMGILNKANDLVTQGKLQAAWSYEGKILVKGRDNRITNIVNLVDLNVFHT